MCARFGPAPRALTQQRTTQLAASLHFSGTTAAELSNLLQRVTDGHWGSGRWAELLAGACAYVVIRQNRRALACCAPLTRSARTDALACGCAQACGHAARSGLRRELRRLRGGPLRAARCGAPRRATSGR